MVKTVWSVLIAQGSHVGPGVYGPWTSTSEDLARVCRTAGVDGVTAHALEVVLPLARALDPTFPWTVTVDESGRCTFTP